MCFNLATKWTSGRRAPLWQKIRLMDGLRAMAEKWPEGLSETKVGAATAWPRSAAWPEWTSSVDAPCSFWCWLAVDAGDEGDVDCRVWSGLAGQDGDRRAEEMTWEVGGSDLPAADQIRKLTRLHIGRLQPGINIKVKKIQRQTSVQFLMLASIFAANKWDICLAPPHFIICHLIVEE